MKSAVVRVSPPSETAESSDDLEETPQLDLASSSSRKRPLPSAEYSWKDWRPQPGAPRTLGAPLQAPLQSREWAGEMGQRLMMMVSTKLNSAQIQVNPRDLGPIDVKVSLQQDQAHVTFTSHAAPTRDALEQAIPRLREMLEQNGVALGDVDVRQQDARESGQQQQRTGRDSGGGSSADPAAEEVRHAVASKRKRESEASDNGNGAKRAPLCSPAPSGWQRTRWFSCRQL